MNSHRFVSHLCSLLATCALFLGGAIRCEAIEVDAHNAASDQVTVDREIELTGRVTNVDRQSGVTRLELAQGEPLVLQFTPQAVANLQPGETITARVTYSISPPPQVMSPAGDAPRSGEPAIRMEGLEAAMGQRTATGTVTKIDRTSGRFDLATNAGILRLQVQPSAVQQLKPDQTIWVDMGFSKATP
jgi:hypothetical protein